MIGIAGKKSVPFLFFQEVTDVSAHFVAARKKMALMPSLIFVLFSLEERIITKVTGFFF